MTLVIDTSVIVKWFVRETGHEEALSLLETRDTLCCPDFALVEAANVLWRKTRGGEVSEGQAQESIRQLPGFFDSVVPAAELLDGGFELAKLLSHSVYDCMFLACALREEGDVLVSDDMAFMKKAAEHGYSGSVRPLFGTGKLVD